VTCPPTHPPTHPSTLQLCRTKTFGREGVSQAQFFDEYLGTIQLNQLNVDWQRTDFASMLPAAYARPLLLCCICLNVPEECGLT
jgi:hypothetical protein